MGHALDVQPEHSTRKSSLDVEGSHSRHSSISAVAVPLPKKLIVCCDGTWMDSDNGWVKGKWGAAGHPQNPSNVTRIARAIQDLDHGNHQQITYYQAGVGTGIGLYDHLIGGGTGAGLSENIREAYSFLASNYSERREIDRPDSIFLIGFSRGAFTARSIGGFIGAIGILKKVAMPYFYEIFQDWENAGNPKKPPKFFDTWFKQNPDAVRSRPSDELAGDKTQIDHYMNQYRAWLLSNSLTQEAKVKCIGVWDTVGALGIPVNPFLTKIFPHLPSFFRDYKWFDTSLDNHIENAFQALGLDERRSPYSPAVWERKAGCETNLKQVWFPGAHSNVGGSYADQGIADITLTWMMDQLAGHTRPKDKVFDDLDWIRFDEKYVTDYYDLQVRQYQTAPTTTFRGWALGKVMDSLTFPQSLAGHTVRKPGRYHKTFYESGNENLKEMLQDTNEKVHISVRYRIDAGARGVESDWDQAFLCGLNVQPFIQWVVRKLTRATRTRTYQPQGEKCPLHHWRLEDGHLSHRTPNGVLEGEIKPVRWVWEGDERLDRMVMEEDTLGKFEIMLKNKDKKVRHVLEVSDEGIVGRIRKSIHAKTL